MNESAQNQLKKLLLHVKVLLPDLESVYKDIHAHPELLMQENRTARIAANRLSTAGYEVTTGIGRSSGGRGAVLVSGISAWF